jgi:hypothetical protein
VDRLNVVGTNAQGKLPQPSFNPEVIEQHSYRTASMPCALRLGRDRNAKFTTTVFLIHIRHLDESQWQVSGGLSNHQEYSAAGRCAAVQPAPHLRLVAAAGLRQQLCL